MQVAPLWTNAFVYMVVGRMVWNFVPTAKILGITAWRFGTYFVILDIMYVSTSFTPCFSDVLQEANELCITSAFIIQLYGAASAEQQSNSVSQTLQGKHADQLYVLTYLTMCHTLGLHIYMAGVGIQQLFILVFIFFATQLHRAILLGKGLDAQTRSCALVLLYTLYAVLALITVRHSPMPFTNFSE